jgi:CubicO group peptidase (beta-lactamase class C family)
MFRHRFQCRLALAAIVIGVAAAIPSAQSAGARPERAQRVEAPSDIDAYVARVLTSFDVPGVSVAVVKDGKVVLAKGYGVRKLGGSEAVDGRTLFGIASNTKVITATALGLLVEEGKIEWDAPVVNYLPWFQLSDPYVTREISVRDLLVHRSGLGLGAGDLLWWPPSTYDRKEIARRLRFLPLSTSFRSAYAYDNVLYLIAGEVIETVSGKSWEDFVASRILGKAGMAGSNVKHSDALAAGNVAATHARVDGKVRVIKPFDSDNTNPAGGVNSNAEDMAKWMMTLLARGRLADGSRLFSDDTYRQLTTLVTPMPFRDPPPDLAALRSNFRGYALGLGVSDYRGKKVLSHTGGLPGYVSKVFMVPELNFGVTVLTNQESGEAFEAIVYYVADHYLGATGTDWLAVFKKLSDRQQASFDEAERKAAQARDTASKPSLALSKYVGTYQDAWYGDIAIEANGPGLVMRFSRTPSLVGDLEHWQHDTFVVRWRDRELRADAFVTFALNPDGSIAQAKMQAVSPATDFSFDFQDLLLKKAPAK